MAVVEACHSLSMTRPEDPWFRSPESWPPVAAEVVQHAKDQALVALADVGDRRAADRLAVFYDTEGHYAGATFADLQPNAWTDITAVDLHATSMLSVNVGPQATRRLLQPGAYRRSVLLGLRALPDRELAAADPAALTAMEEFYLAVKDALSSSNSKDPNPWVTTSKLCARKRPDLFPVRDRNVCAFLGILGLNDFRADWLVIRALVQDSEICDAVDALPEATRAAASGRLLAIDHSRLRLLDAAIWTYTVWYDKSAS